MNDTCPECHVHRGHKATCSRSAGVDVKAIMDAFPDYSIEAYREFIRRKKPPSLDFGVAIDPGQIHPWLKPHQRVAVEWAVRGGRRALFESFGLGKTVQQLEILRLTLAQAGGRGLIVAPLGVRQEFMQDAERIGIPLKFIRSIEECEPNGIYLTNYETVRDGKLEPFHFRAASLDEAAILRGFGGTKTFREFMRKFEAVPYRFKLFRKFSMEQVYDFEHHVHLGEVLEERGILPVKFMLLQPQSWHPDVWTDITRMRTLNGAQSAKGREMHLCPMQFDLADRVIKQLSQPGEVVLDPFGGLGTVAMKAVETGRFGLSIELNPAYWYDSITYCKAAEEKRATPTLFDLEPEEEETPA